MKEQTVDEVYTANSEVRTRLMAVLEGLSEEKAAITADGEKWSIAAVLEHVVMVEAGAIKICSRLLEKAKEHGSAGDGKIRFSDDFMAKAGAATGTKLEAPEIVQPSGERSLASSLEALRANGAALDALKETFRSLNTSEPKFPHPYFGPLSAGEWLSLVGGHEMRHVRQIKALRAKE